MKNIIDLTIEMNKVNYTTIPAVQSDSNSRFLNITLVNNALPCDITGHTVVISGTKQDGTSIFNSCNIIDPVAGLVEVQISEQINAVEGKVDCELKIYGADNSVLTTKPFIILVTKSVSNKNVVSSNEFTALTEALGKVTTIDNKMNRGESIAVNQIDKNKGKLDQTYMTDEFLQQIVGNTPVNAVPADGSITTPKYAMNSINETHTSFIKPGFNLFDKNKLSAIGWWCSTANGNPEQNQYTGDKRYTELIPIVSGEKYITSIGVHSYCTYDIQRNFISGTVATREPITIPNNGAFIILNVYKDYVDSIQLQKGTIITNDYPYEISISNLDVANKFEDVKSDIYSIPSLHNKFGTLDTALEASFNKVQIKNEYQFKPFDTWAFATSTFSGWASYIGSNFTFNKLIFKVRGRAGESTNITKIVTYLQKGNHDGEILCENTFTVNISPGAEETIMWDLPVITTAGDEGLYFSFQCDAKCDMYRAGNTTPPHPSTRYSTDGTIQHPSKMIVVSGNASGGGAVVWTKLELVSHKYSIPVEAMASLMNKHAFDKTFTLENGMEKTGESGKSLGDAYATSTFSGWGTYIGTFSQVGAVKFTIKNRDTKPTTTVKCYITEFNKDGRVLAEGTLNVNVSVGATQEVTWVLNRPLINSTNKKLYFIYQCNSIITLNHTSLPGQSDDKTYGWNTYVINGEFVTPSQMTKVYGETSGGTAGIWCEIGNIYSIYKPTNEFLSFINQPGTSSNSCRVVLPDLITAVVGDNLQLFYRGIVEVVNPYNYDIRVRCSKGKAFPRYYEYTPTAEDIGVYDFTIEVYDNHKNLLGKDTCKLKVVQVGNAPTSSINVLCVGDSLTAGGTWCTEVHRRLTKSGGTPSGHGKSNINFIGTQSNSSGSKWEGYGGWTWDNYLAKPNITTSDIWVNCNHDKTSNDQHSIWQDSSGSKWSLETIQVGKLKFTRYQSHTNPPPSAPGELTHVSNATNTSRISFTSCDVANGNPFWDMTTNKVNFKKYCEKHGFAKIDYVYTLLTWNGGVVDKWDIEHHANMITSAKKFIDILHQDYPNAKVRVMGIQLPSVNGGTAVSYGANGGYADAYGLIRGVFGMNLAYQDMCNETAYKSFVEFIQTSAEFDSEYNMPNESIAVNNRSNIKELRGSNGVHPSTDGYLQIGDVAYRNLVKDLLQNN